MLETKNDEMKVLAKEVFDGLRFGKINIKNKDIKFYNVEGQKMAFLAINYNCDEEGKKCHGCENCINDKEVFAKEYDYLTSTYKTDMISIFTELEKEVAENSKYSKQ